MWFREAFRAPVLHVVPVVKNRLRGPVTFGRAICGPYGTAAAGPAIRPCYTPALGAFGDGIKRGIHWREILATTAAAYFLAALMVARVELKLGASLNVTR